MTTQWTMWSDGRPTVKGFYWIGSYWLPDEFHVEGIRDHEFEPRVVEIDPAEFGRRFSPESEWDIPSDYLVWRGPLSPPKIPRGWHPKFTFENCPVEACVRLTGLRGQYMIVGHGQAGQVTVRRVTGLRFSGDPFKTNIDAVTAAVSGRWDKKPTFDLTAKTGSPFYDETR